jgi:predicted alpha/beta-hydrolase family hydrolase
MNKTHEIEIQVPGRGAVEAILDAPQDPTAVYVLAHGAGAGMRHPFLAEVAALLNGAGIATLRYQFPYVQAGGRRPDPPAVLEETVRAAVSAAADRLPGTPLFAGGKSMGGRMTSQAAAADLIDGVNGLVFLGFPLHAPGSAGVSRAAHLDRISVPMLFIQGTRDALADLDLMRTVCSGLGSRATLHVVEGGDHSFKVLKSSGKRQSDVMGEIRDEVAAWMGRIVAQVTAAGGS